ncbi:toxin-antitoxin system YwqK family antitoxin [Desulfovibrio sp. TomC]|uniref:toxin-antitoxin system YwqK family antitoxin n=1 Tax=Desulfovibrio sp. TomC TaxID=1562888 RepID=UPI0005B83ABF|nr:hypothetical protein [Desulfovibrio sp. TomC]
MRISPLHCPREKVFTGLATVVFLCLPLILPASLWADTDSDMLLLTMASHTPRRAKTSKVLGPQGGTLAVAGISVSVPPGALGSDRAVTLQQVDPSGYYGASGSRAYNLEMGTGGHCLPVAVAITGVSGGDRSMAVALGDVLDDGSGVASRPLPRLVSGNVQGGILRVSIPATETCETAASTRGLKLASPAVESFSLELAPDWLTTPRGQFVVYHPTALLGSALVEDIIRYAQEASRKLTGMGFEFADTLDFPVTINLVHGLGARDGESGIPLYGKAYGYLNINLDRCIPGNMDNVRATVGHEFFHLVQNTYDPRFSIAIRHPSATPFFLWLAEASSVWFEAGMLDNSDYVSPVFTLNIDTMRNGLETYGNDRTGAQNRGYWASGFQRYLNSQHTGGLVPLIWRKVRAQGATPNDYSDLRAVFEALASPDSVAQDWRCYVGKFISGSTGYPGWPQPASNATLYPDGSTAVMTQPSLEPFSAQKISIIFRNDVSQDFQISALAQSPVISFSLYHGKAQAGPFQFLADLVPGSPRTVTASHGDIYLVAVANTDTQAPYQAPAQATVLVGSSSHADCVWCPDVPANAIVDLKPDLSLIRWTHPTAGYFMATAYYYDQQLQHIQSAICNWENGYQQAQYDYYEDGALMMRSYFDQEGKYNGQKIGYYQNGYPWWIHPYDHGYLEGQLLGYWDNGNIRYRYDRYTHGVMSGYLTTYDAGGACLSRERWVNGSPQYTESCP